jgi:hypothetical protein
VCIPDGADEHLIARRLNPIFGGIPMLWTIVVLLLILWVLGYAVFSVGTLIHILLVLAVVAVLVRIIQGRRPL